MFDHETHKLLRDIIERLYVIDRRLGRLEELFELPPQPTCKPKVSPTSISFQEITMLAPVAGNTLVYTGTLIPVGSVFPTDSTFVVTSSDPTVSPTVDVTGLVVTIPLPSTFVDNPSAPFSVTYTATSASVGMSIAEVITPSIPAPPPVTPTGITFTQTT